MMISKIQSVGPLKLGMTLTGFGGQGGVYIILVQVIKNEIINYMCYS